MIKSYLHIAITSLCLSLAYYLPAYFAGCVCVSKAKMQGKTVIITGANRGSGKETALDLAKRGARVIMACRNLKKGEAALKEIIKESGNTNVVLRQLDLASLKSIRAFSENILQTEQRLDVLINNAALSLLPQRTITEDGLEMVMAVNHLGHFLLTNLLLELLKKSAPSRIVVVSSKAHWAFCSNMQLDNVNSEKEYGPYHSYGHSKLANILFTRQLARILNNTGVTVNSLHPGTFRVENERTGLMGVLVDIWWLVSAPFCKSVKQGAQTTIHLAVSEQVENITGAYFEECGIASPSRQAEDDETARKLWDISAKLVKLDLNTSQTLD